MKFCINAFLRKCCQIHNFLDILNGKLNFLCSVISQSWKVQKNSQINVWMEYRNILYVGISSHRFEPKRKKNYVLEFLQWRSFTFEELRTVFSGLLFLSEKTGAYCQWNILAEISAVLKELKSTIEYNARMLIRNNNNIHAHTNIYTHMQDKLHTSTHLTCMLTKCFPKLGSLLNDNEGQIFTHTMRK